MKKWVVEEIRYIMQNLSPPCPDSSVQLNTTVINLHLFADVCIQDMLSVTADKDY